MKYCLLFLSLCAIAACKSNAGITVKNAHHTIGYYGRALADADNNIVLIGSASYIEFGFSGDTCIIWMKNIAGEGDYNYVAVEVDNQYTGRRKVEGSRLRSFTITTASRRPHIVRIYKATEAANGQVVIERVEGRGIRKLSHPTRLKIEFIGNSITCGMGNDLEKIPCGQGKWYDQHNAYWAYGPRLARTLNTDFMLSAVSGIGIYRNWNSDGPVMPQVYESAHLNWDSSLRWDFNNYVPDIVSICLGTNDFSDGDGKQERLPFDSAAFIKQYVDFVNTIYSHYPHTQVALLTSPMLSGPKAALLLACLKRIQATLTIRHPDKPHIEIFPFATMQPKGCGYHPDIHDHQLLAEQLTPFFKGLLEKIK
jgi:lysophospholipase L1-like esterase